MDVSAISDDVGNTAAVIAEEKNEDVAASNDQENTINPPELFDTSSLTRRLARGEYTQSIARKISEPSTASSSAPTSSLTSEASFEPCPRSDISASVNRELFQAIGEDDSGVNQSYMSELSNANAPPSTPQRPQSTIAVPDSTNSNKSALDSFSEYISFFFKNVEDYEEKLERSESQRDLKVSTVRKNRRESRFSSPEQADNDDDDDVGMKEIIFQQQGSIEQTESRDLVSSPSLTLSESQEAMAAVEAICNFRSLREVKKEIMDRGGTPKREHPKEQKASDSVIGQEADTDIDVRESWDRFCSEKKGNKFNGLGLESIPLPVSVDDFYKQVLDDNADHSIDKFMRDIGELEVESTSWQPSVPTLTAPANRTIQYIHPINAPMAPPTAAARKEQCLQKFGNVGLCLETSTFVENVPMADCFVVRDRLWVNENSEEGGCIVSITFQIDFIKGTMFRRIIENTTRGEYQKYWTQFWDMIKSNLGSSIELDEVAIELEEATLLLEASEGQEVPLSSVLGRIRSSSRRLSVVARRASVRNINGTAEKMENSMVLVVIGKGKVVVLELFTIVKQHVKEHFAEKDDSYVLGCCLILMLGMFNIMALRQISAMNRSIATLTKQINEAILTNMGSGENCAMK
mmetsp:Transcript_12320/g.18297  ORF Transcript_12320/g.18297 Transcript_12320/m.18297 type:complete len:634 (-) Transcript_12320:100-2001(-)